MDSSESIRRTPVLIVGAGPAGCAAAIQCVRLGIPPMLVDRTGQPGGLIRNAWRVENYLGLEPMDGRHFVRRMAGHLRRFGVEVVRCDVHCVRVGADAADGGPGPRGRRAVPVNRAEGAARTVAAEARYRLDTSLGTIEARSVILAVGTAPRRLAELVALEGAPSMGDAPHRTGRRLVWYEIAEMLDGGDVPARVVVVGGGEAALDYALSLVRAGARVTLVVRGRGFRTTGRLVAQVGASDRIDVLFETRVQAARAVEGWAGDRSIVLDLESAGAIQRSTSGAVVVAIGRRSAVRALLRGEAAVHAGSGRLSPGPPGVFVAGNARFGALGQASMAAGDGLEAATRAAAYLGERFDDETALHDR